MVRIDVLAASLVGLAACSACGPPGESETDVATPGPIRSIAVGGKFACLNDSGNVECRFIDVAVDEGQTEVPASIRFTTISAGYGSACGVKEDASLACWGVDGNGQVSQMPTTGAYKDVTVGSYHGCALTTDGEARCWGLNKEGESTPPSGQFEHIHAGSMNTCALDSGGRPICWGSDFWGGVSNVPQETLASIDLASSTVCGLTPKGEIRCWGRDEEGRASPPAGEGYQDLGLGTNTGCAIDPQGEAVCWGDMNEHYLDPPAGPFAQLSSQLWATCGLREDGSIACWGCAGQDADWSEYCPEYGCCVWE